MLMPTVSIRARRKLVLYTENIHDPMIALPCQRKGKPAYWVFFIVDAGAPSTELSPTAMDKVCQAGNIPSCVDLFIAGVKAEVHLCDQSDKGNHKDVPILGKNFFLKIGATLSIDYEDGTCSLLKKK